MDTQTPRPHSGTPLLVLGFGDFGFHLVRAAGALVRQRPLDPAPIGLWAGPQGWSVLPATGEPDAGREAATLASGFNELLGRVRDRRDAPQVILAVALHEAQAWEQAWKVVEELDGPPWTSAGVDFSLTVLIATDTAAYASVSTAEQAGLCGRLQTLEVRVQQASERLDPGRIGWVYLLDPRDGLGRPVLDSAGPVPQAWLGAEFLALLAAGLGRSPDYQRTSLWHVARAHRGDGRARVAALKAASFVAPLRARTEQAARDLAGTILATALGDAPAPIRAQARRRADHWIEACGLSQTALRRQIASPGATLPAVQPDTPNVAAPLTADDLDQIEAWRRQIEAEWDHDPQIEVQVATRGRQIADRARAWLTASLTELETDLACGFPEARALLDEARSRLMVARLERPQPRVGKRTSWRQRLWNALGRAIERPGLPPKVAALLQHGRDWLRRHQAIRISWRGALLSAGIWLALGLVALVWLGPVVLGLTILAPVFFLSIGASTVFPWVAARGAAWIEQRLTDIALHHQIEGLIHATRERFQIRLEQSLEQTMAQVYADVAADLERLETILAQARADLEAAQQDLSRLDDEDAWGQTETLVWPDPPPDAQSPAPASLNWPIDVRWVEPLTSSGPTQICDQLLEQTRLLVTPLFRPLGLAALARTLVERAQQAAETHHVAWPCRASEATTFGARTSGSLVLLGLPSKVDGGCRPSSVLPADATFSTGEAGRSAYVLLATALPLMTLGAWSPIDLMTEPHPNPSAAK